MMSDQTKGGGMSKKVRGQVLSFLREVLFVASMVLLVNSFLLASFEVPTGSMEDTVKIGDYLFVNKFVYGGATPYTIPFTTVRIPHFRVPGVRGVARGDVIVFDWPGSRDQVKKPQQTWYLKRCIGLPGDTIRIQDRVVYVNGRAFPNPPHAKFMRNESVSPGLGSPYIFPRGSGFNEDNYGPLVVPKRGSRLSVNAENFSEWEVFIQREGHTADLRGRDVFIDGIAASEYKVQKDYAFAMGDSRDNSLDSRFWGFVPLEDIIGTPMIVFWSWDPEIPSYDIFNKLASIRFGRIGTLIR